MKKSLHIYTFVLLVPEIQNVREKNYIISKTVPIVLLEFTVNLVVINELTFSNFEIF